MEILRRFIAARRYDSGAPRTCRICGRELPEGRYLIAGGNVRYPGSRARRTATGKVIAYCWPGEGCNVRR
jgi:hypothetical protein